MHRTAVVLALAGLLAAAPAARAQSPGETAAEGAREQSCRALAAGSGGTPDHARADPATGLPAAWPQAPAGLLPDRVGLRTQTESFNRLYDFALRKGDLYARERREGGTWRQAPLPACIAGRLTGISADDDELVALDQGRRVYTLDNILKDAALWNWTSRWGTPVWLGPGYALPGGVQAWAWSVISPVEDRSWVDPAGNRTPIGSGKVSHIWGLRDGGQRLTFWDPWLALDESYEMCGPHRGRFRAVNLSASGSHVFVIGSRGDMFTRLYDFDISGHDPVFFSYSYEDQRGKGDGAPIQLPAEPWAEQPKIPGEITSAISIHKTGPDSIHRILRVEGSASGTTGYWERDIAAPRSAGWTFVRTGRPLSGTPLRNPRRDTSAAGLGPAEDARYVMDAGGVRAELSDFNVYCSPARLHVREADGTQRDLVLHHVDGLRQAVRGRGLDDTPRAQYGAIQHPGGTFEPATVQATRSSILLEERGWRFERAPGSGSARPSGAPRCLKAAIAMRSTRLGPLRLGMTRRAAARRLPKPSARRGTTWRWCVTGGGRVTGVFANGRLALVVTTARGHAAAGVGTGATAARARAAFPARKRVTGAIVRAARRSRVLLALRGGRVRFVALARSGVVNRPARLRRHLRAAGRGMPGAARRSAPRG
jgi:hypothetical protein